MRPTELGKRARPSCPRILRCYRSAPGRLGSGRWPRRSTRWILPYEHVLGRSRRPARITEKEG